MEDVLFYGILGMMHPLASSLLLIFSLTRWRLYPLLLLLGLVALTFVFCIGNVCLGHLILKVLALANYSTPYNWKGIIPLLPPVLWFELFSVLLLIQHRPASRPRTKKDIAIYALLPTSVFYLVMYIALYKYLTNSYPF